jgi:DNA-binding NtrC family response regulator
MNRPRVLIVEDRPSVLKLLTTVLEGAYDVTAASSGATAIALVGTLAFDVVLTDVRMPEATGFDVLRAVQDRSPRTAVVMITAYASVADAVAAIRLGAYDYVAKPLDASDLSLVVARAVEHARDADDGSSESVGNRFVASDGEDDVEVGFHRAVDEPRRPASHDYLVRLMRLFRGNVTRAAVRAGMTRESLHRVLRQYEVRSEQFKPPGIQPAHSADGPAPLTGREVHDGDEVVVTLRDHGG